MKTAKRLGYLWVTMILGVPAVSIGAPASEDLTNRTQPSVTSQQDASAKVVDGQSGSGVTSGGAASFRRGEHPWPRGDEWPKDLHGPFEADVDPMEVTAFDGVKLRGALWLPKVERPGVKLPTILWNSPYFGNLDAPADDPNEKALFPLSDPDGQIPHGVARRIPRTLLVENGFAFAAVSVRGTGQSGGCMTLGGEEEQQDQRVLIEWLAAQPWSNGRVGTIGVSYDGSVAMKGAVEGPSPLKTAVAVAAPIDYYTGVGTTPEGASPPAYVVAQAPSNHAIYDGTTIPRDPEHAGSGVDGALRFLGIRNDGDEGSEEIGASLLERACADVVEHIRTGINDTYSDDRNEEFYLERRLFDDLDNISSAMLIAQGLKDSTVLNWGLDAVGWELINAPKSMLLGQWSHCVPKDLSGDWDRRLIRWFDFWLKGLGDPPAELGYVDYEINTDPSSGRCIPSIVRDDDLWQRSTEWPPKSTRNEVLYLREGKLQRSPGDTGPAEFVASPSRSVSDALCSSRRDAVAFTSETLSSQAAITGSPFAYLRMTSPQDRGVVLLTLIDISDDFECSENPEAFRTVAFGAMDLRFYRGNFSALPFPDEVVNLRVSFPNLAEMIPAGHRLGLIVSGPTLDEGDYSRFAGLCNGACAPEIFLLAGDGSLASQLVLPVSIGSAGGSNPRVGYPGRVDLET